LCMRVSSRAVSRISCYSRPGVRSMKVATMVPRSRIEGPEPGVLDALSREVSGLYCGKEAPWRRAPCCFMSREAPPPRIS